jgi:hypothetical protein
MSSRLSCLSFRVSFDLLRSLFPPPRDFGFFPHPRPFPSRPVSRPAFDVRLQPSPFPPVLYFFRFATDYLIAVFPISSQTVSSAESNRAEDKPVDRKVKQRTRHSARRVRVRGTERKSGRATTRVGGGTASERREGMRRVDGKGKDRASSSRREGDRIRRGPTSMRGEDRATQCNEKKR